MKMPKYSINDVVLVGYFFSNRVIPMIINRIFIDENGISYQGKDGFEGDDIIVYNEEEYDFNGEDPVYKIIDKVGNVKKYE